MILIFQPGIEADHLFYSKDAEEEEEEEPERVKEE
jgi:hypothetical protein